MALILRGISDSELAVSQHLYVLGDDDGLWYEVGFSYDSGLGVYIWSTPSLVTLPNGTVNISDRLMGSSIWITDGIGTWHQMVMTQTDPPTGYAWTDYTQSTSTPSAHRRVPKARADDGIYIADIDGAQIHKMGVTGGEWAELTQGYTVPL